MTTFIPNKLDPSVDVTGSQTQKQDLIRSEEPLQLGSRIVSQSGSSASIINSSGTITISGLTGMSGSSVGRFLSIFLAGNAVNNGTFLIIAFNSTSSVDISNIAGLTDGNNGSIAWIERSSYSLEDDINYSRTDRKLIKGTSNWHDSLPTYIRPTDTITNIDASLTNIASKTTDALAFVLTRKLENANALVGDDYIFCSSTGNLPYANNINTEGIPVDDLYDAGNDEATYCEIINPSTGAPLEVLTGVNAGNRIFGRSRKGVNGVDGNSFEAELRSVPSGEPISSSIAYIYESGQPSIVDIFYGYRNRFDLLSETAFRTTMVNGLSGSGDASMPKPTEYGQILYAVDSVNLEYVNAKPIINDEGLILINEDDVMVVVT